MVKLLSVTRVQSSTQLVARKQIKKHLRRVRNKEYGRLRDMVPTIANKNKISKVSQRMVFQVTTAVVEVLNCQFVYL